MVFNNIDNCCWDSNLQVTFTVFLVFDCCPTWPPWCITLGHGDDEPDTDDGEPGDGGDQEALDPVHDLDPLRLTQLGPMCVTWCQHSLPRHRISLKHVLYLDKSSMSMMLAHLLCQIVHQVWKSIFTYNCHVWYCSADVNDLQFVTRLWSVTSCHARAPEVSEHFVTPSLTWCKRSSARSIPVLPGPI